MKASKDTTPKGKRKEKSILREIPLVKDTLLLIVICVCLALPSIYNTITLTVADTQYEFEDGEPLPSSAFIESVELVYYEGDSADPLDLSKMEIIEVLDRDLIDTFMEDIGSASLAYTAEMNMYVGEYIRVVRVGGFFDLYGCIGTDAGFDSFYATFRVEDGALNQLIGSFEYGTDFLALRYYYFSE